MAPVPPRPGRNKKMNIISPKSRLTNTSASGILNFDVPLHKVAPPATVTHANSGAGFYNFVANPVDSTLDLFAD